MAVQWAAPPADAVKGGEKRTKWGEVAGMLRTRPGEWAVVATKSDRTAAVGLANGISGGKRAEFAPAGSFASAYAPSEDGSRFDVFARYVDADANGSAPVDVSDDVENDDDWDDEDED